jgi:hypothetical protein
MSLLVLALFAGVALFFAVAVSVMDAREDRARLARLARHITG